MLEPAQAASLAFARAGNREGKCLRSLKRLRRLPAAAGPDHKPAARYFALDNELGEFEKDARNGELLCLPGDVPGGDSRVLPGPRGAGAAAAVAGLNFRLGNATAPTDRRAATQPSSM